MRASVIPILLPVTVIAGKALVPLIQPAGKVVADNYIVKFKDSVSTINVIDTFNIAEANIHHVYNESFRGFAGKLTRTEVQRLRARSDVEFIEQDAEFQVTIYEEQPGAEWGLIRISHRQRGALSYVFDNSAGIGACSYVIDTGVDGSHPDFAGRASQIKTFVSGQSDGNGHGTHLAGIIGSKTYGVAKQSTIFGVKVLDDNGSGTISNVIAGMQFVATDAKTRPECAKGAMANLSIGGSFSVAVNKAAAALVSSGVFVSVAAGGDNSDAGNTSPGSEPTVCTTGASTMSDTRASSSNYGPLVDIFAPGDRIKSTWLNGGTNTLSGASTAAAHITGLGAYLAALEGFPGGQQLCKRIQELATRNALGNIPANTLNLLAFNGNPTG